MNGLTPFSKRTAHLYVYNCFWRKTYYYPFHCSTSADRSISSSSDCTVTPCRFG